jgi:glycosyltransferase involved in cell wall biosynthesis
MHDNTLARALLSQGDQVLLVPTYTPIRTDEENVSLPRVFFGGVNVFLQQQSALFRHTPWFIDRMFDSPKLIRWLSRRSAAVDVAKLGALTVSTLEGEHGKQRKEIEKLIHWLAAEEKPELIHLSNALLIGMAGPLRRRLKVPIVCNLAGEDWLLEQLQEPHYNRARELLRQRANDVDQFVAYNNYFADFMSEYVGVDRSRIEVIPHGLRLDGHEMRRGTQPGEPFTIGYFGRIASEKGLHLLVEAFALLCEEPGMPPLRLRLAGYKSPGDEPYFDTLHKRIRELGLTDQFEYVGEPDRAGKIKFLHTLDAMALPTVYRESKGLAALEALANGVPLVAVRHGMFPELIRHTGGGLLCEPNNPADMAAKLRDFIRNPALAAEYGRRGREAILSHYSADQMARKHRELYRRLGRTAAPR